MPSSSSFLISDFKVGTLDGIPGVDKIRIHDLRHTVATKLDQEGKDAKFIAQNTQSYTLVKPLAPVAQWIEHWIPNANKGIFISC